MSASGRSRPRFGPPGRRGRPAAPRPRGGPSAGPPARVASARRRSGTRSPPALRPDSRRNGPDGGAAGLRARLRAMKRARYLVFFELCFVGLLCLGTFLFALFALGAEDIGIAATLLA